MIAIGVKPCAEARSIHAGHHGTIFEITILVIAALQVQVQVQVQGLIFLLVVVL